MKEKVSVSMDYELFEKINTLSENKYISRSAIIALALTEYIKNHSEDLIRK